MSGGVAARVRLQAHAQTDGHHHSRSPTGILSVWIPPNSVQPPTRRAMCPLAAPSPKCAREAPPPTALLRRAAGERPARQRCRRASPPTMLLAIADISSPPRSRECRLNRLLRPCYPSPCGPLCLAAFWARGPLGGCMQLWRGGCAGSCLYVTPLVCLVLPSRFLMGNGTNPCGPTDASELTNATLIYNGA